MRPLIFLIVLFFLNNCSFDNKSGIWNSDENSAKKNSASFDEFKPLTYDKEIFDKIIDINKDFIFQLPSQIKNSKWSDVYYNQSNNYSNFSYNDRKSLIFKSKKLSSRNISSLFLYDRGNLIFSDSKGNLIIFSIESNKAIIKFNFYKKKYKKIDKNLNIVLDKDLIYVTDNLGFIYAFNYIEEKILWAKDVKVPFRSNLKIKGDKLIAADQNNNVYFLNKKNGEILKLIPTEDSNIKNNFKNSFSYNKDLIFFLNTYGSLYAINNSNNQVKWVINLNQSLDINPNNLFNANQIISNDDIIIVTSHDATYVIDALRGTIKQKFNIISQIKPLILNHYLFLVSSNNFLISINLKSGEIIYSYDLDKKIADFLKIKKKKTFFKSIVIANDKILILLKNSYFLELEINGNIKNVFKLPKKIYSDFIFIDNSILYLDRKNKFIILG